MKVALFLVLGAALVAGGVGLWYWLGVRGHPRTPTQAGRSKGLALPFPEDQILDVVRRELFSRPDLPDPYRRDLLLPLKVDVSAALRSDDRKLLGYRVTVLIDPHLGVPVNQPDAVPEWGASRVFVVTLAPSGDRLILNMSPGGSPA